jgi:hypothetical protein
MSFASECEAARLECLESRAAARQREFDTPLRASINELLGARQQRVEQAQEDRRALWGAPPQGGLSRPSSAIPGLRNARFQRP